MPALHALDPGKSIFQFNCRNWSRLAGLPADKISAITQAPDGYIWLGSQNGLIRFDGQEFKVIPISLPEAQGQDVRQMQCAEDGKVWFSIGGGGYGSYDGKKFSPISDSRWTAPGANSNFILVAHDGAIWTASVFGWGRWMPGKPEETHFDDKLGPVITLWEDRLGRVWIGTPEKGLFYWEHGDLKSFPDTDLKQHNIRSIVQDRAGDLWVGTSSGTYRYDADFHRKEIFFSTTETNALLVDRHGLLWAGTKDFGLCRFQEGKFTMLRKADGFGSDSVTSLFEDAEGSLWVGTVEGLSQLSDLKFPIYSDKEGLVAGAVISITASPQGGLWIGATGGATYFDGHKATNYTDDSIFFGNHYVRRVFVAKNNDVYLADGSKNVSVLANGRLIARFSNDQWPETFAEDATGIVVGIGPDLYRIRDYRLEPYQFEGETPYFDWFNSLYIATDGAIWAGTNHGLFRIKDGKTKRWSVAEGLSSDRVHFVLQDIDGSIWAGLPTGLIRIKDDRVTKIVEDDGLTDARIYAIVPDDHGFFWLASGRGILRVSRENLTDFAEGKTRHITCDSFDGLESVKFIDRTDQGYSACKTRDGRIWFPNPRGVVMVDPVNYVTNRVPPRVHIEKIRVKDREFTDQRTAALEVGDRNVEFFFSALSYIAPKKIQIRYKLDGFDTAWGDGEGQRSVRYNNLKSGRYTFHVQAANADGVWNTTGDEFKIVLPPPFYERFWFYALSGLAVALALFGGYQWKVQRLQASQQKLQAANELLESKVGQRTDELANSLALLRATLDSTADGILAVRLSDKMISYNRQFAEMWKMPPEMDGNATHAELRAFATTQVRDPVRYAASIEKIFSKPEAEVFDILELKDGRIFERYSKPQRVNGQCVGVVINFRDVTERKHAEEAIAEASALLESMLTNTLDLMYFKDRDSRFVRYSEALVRHHGLEQRDALRGKTDFDILPKDQAQIYFTEEQEIIRTGRPVIDRLDKTILPKGDVTWTMTTKTPWRDTHGNIIGTFGVTRDVTELKEAEFGLAYERDLLRALLDSSPDQIYFKDRESRFIKCSKAQAANFKVASPDHMVGKTDFDFFTRDHAQPAFDDEQEIIRTGRPLIGKIEKEVWIDGRVSWVLTSKIPLRDNVGEIIGTVGISKDITPLKAAEEKLEQVHRQLLETSRQAGMAEVATSVLHNVGNVLNSVNVSATLVTEQMRASKAAYVPKIGAMLQARAADIGAFLTSDPKGKILPSYLATLGEELLAEQRAMTEELGHLRKNIDHIKEIVAMQQSFAKVSGVVETIPLAELVDDALRINSSALTRHEVALVRDYTAQPIVTLERHKVLQVLVNLIRNAKYACDDSMRTDKQVIVRISEDDRSIKIAVIDNGIGIPAENLTRIFAHGFTTRKEGHGFGLHSGALTAKELGGALTAHSDGAGLGAVFTLVIPRLVDSSPDSKPESGAGRPKPNHFLQDQTA